MNWNKFWLWYDVFFAVCNTIFAMLVTETRAMYFSAWCEKEYGQNNNDTKGNQK